MKHSIFFVVSYFILTTCFIFSIVMISLFYQFHTMGGKIDYAYDVSKNTNFRALPQDRVATRVFVPSVDVRIGALHSFLSRYNSPLSDYSEKFVLEADKNNLDYRLLPAIAMQESNLCKKTLESAPYNCWGFGIYGTKRTGFDSYDHAIERVSKTLSEKYAAYGLTNPEDIMTKYTPGSNGSWAEGVSFFMGRIDTYTN